MTDEQWLSAIKRYGDENRRWQFKNRELVGGASTLALELKALAKSDPRRFAHFFLRLPESANSIYGQQLLQGLAEAGQVDKDITITALRTAHAHRDRPFGIQITRIIKHHPACARDEDVFRALALVCGTRRGKESWTSVRERPTEEFPSIADLVPANTNLVLNGINSARGVAWEVLGQLVQSNSDRVAEIWLLSNAGPAKRPSHRCGR